jgi:hypothetical protein
MEIVIMVVLVLAALGLAGAFIEDSKKTKVIKRQDKAVRAIAVQLLEAKALMTETQLSTLAQATRSHKRAPLALEPGQYVLLLAPSASLA